jgi:site-specific recombinase XerD
MPNTDRDLIAELAAGPTKQSYNPVVVTNYCAYAREFLVYLAEHEISVTAVTPSQVAQYLRHARRTFRKRRGRQPARDWHSIPRSGIHAMLRLARGQWPPEPDVVGPEATLRHEICLKYETWLRDDRGLAAASIIALTAEARSFLTWQLERGGAASLKKLSVRDIDLYMDGRTPGLRRKSLRDYAERLPSVLRYMHRTGYVASDLAAHVIGPLLYAYEGVPSILQSDQIAAVLKTTKRDTSPMGLRDYAILQLLANYGLRSGDIRNLTMEDIDWRAEPLRVRHSKTGACSFLPLLAPVGDALLDYLRRGRPRTDRREVFMRARALSPLARPPRRDPPPIIGSGGQTTGEIRASHLPTCPCGRDAACVGTAEDHRRRARPSIDRGDDPLSQARHRGPTGDRARRAGIVAAIRSFFHFVAGK